MRSFLRFAASIGLALVASSAFAATANDDWYSAVIGRALTVQSPGILGNDTDPESDPLQVSTVNGVVPEAFPYQQSLQRGFLTVYQDGGFTYDHDGTRSDPTQDGYAQESFFYTVTDGMTESNTALVILDEVENQAPTVTDDAYSVSPGGQLDVPVPGLLANDSDPNGDVLTVSKVNVIILALQESPYQKQLSNGLLTVYEDGRITYDHQGEGDADTAGDTFTYMASDGLLESTNQAKVTISVQSSSAPTARDDEISMKVGSSIDLPAPGILENDTLADDPPVTVSTVNGVTPESFPHQELLPHGLLAVYQDGRVTYDHDGSQPAGDGLLDSFSYTVTDGVSDSSPASVRLVAMPWAAADDYSTGRTQKLSVVAPGVLDNDRATAGSLVVLSVEGTVFEGEVALTLGSGATLRMLDTGEFEYDPASLAEPETSSDQFSYTAADANGAFGPATVTVHLVDAPVAVDDAYTVEVGALVDDAAPGILGNDTDPQADLLSVATVDGVTAEFPHQQQLAHGFLTVYRDGRITYQHDGTPVDSFEDSPQDAFTYTATDGSTVTNEAIVKITAQAPSVPVAADDSYSLWIGRTLDVPAPGILGNDTDPESDPLTVASINGVMPEAFPYEVALAQGNLTIYHDGRLTYQHDGTPPDSGSEASGDWFFYTATDGSTESNDGWVSLGAQLPQTTTSNGPPAAMVHPNLARGDGSVFHSFPFDKVNAFNGNLRLDIPMGGSYPLSSRYSYRFVLSYNSNTFDLEEHGHAGVTTKPMELSSAGIGWDLSLGRLIAPAAPFNSLERWIYVSPDGAAHPFYETLHPGVGTAAPDVFYTRDSTYLRMRRIDANTAVVENGDGLTRTFAFDPMGNLWRLASLSDPFGNWLDVDYLGDSWELTDSHGRFHRVVFEPDGTGVYDALIDRIEVAAFGGTIAVYDFFYGSITASRPASDTDENTSSEIDVPVLRSLALPDGTRYGFTYNGAEQARVMAMTLPTLGIVEWSYGDYWFARGSAASGCNGGDLPGILRSNRGLATRRTVGADGAVEGEWRITRGAQGPLEGVCYPGLGHTVITPLGDQHRYYFTVTTGPATGGDSGAYGLPVHHAVTDGLGRPLAERAWDCDSGGANCSTARSWYSRYEQDAPASPLAFDGMQVNRRVVSRRTLYHGDGRVADLDLSEFDGLGHYRRSVTGGNFGKADFMERIVDYDVSAGTYPGSGWTMPSPSAPWILDTFRQTRVSDGTSTEVVDFCFDGSTGRRTRERLRVSASAPSAADVVTTYSFDAAGNMTDEHYYGGDGQAVGTTAALCSLPLPSSDVYRLRHTYQYGVRAASYYAKASGSTMGHHVHDWTIDRNTGLPSSRRDVAGLQTTLEYDAMRRLTREQPQAGGGAVTEYTYRNATGATRETVKAVFSTRRSNDGSQELFTGATYFDAFGRQWLEREKIEAHPVTKWSNRMRSYNPMGWLTAETEGSTAWGLELAAGNLKQYLEYDPFGRPGRIVHADGSEESIEHYGIRREVRTFQRGYYHINSTVVEKEQVVETIRDRQGRIWKVLNTKYTDGDWDGAPVTEVTEYHYDARGRRIVELEGGLDLVRRVYDGRGFLTEEDRRILPGISHLITTFQNHDPMGLTGLKTTTRQRLSVPTTWDEVVEVQNLYDRAGRLVKVKDPNAWPVWREYAYATANGTTEDGTTDWRKGRLVEAIRHHVRRNVNAPNYWNYWGNVAQRYTYAGVGGGVSELETSVFDNKHSHSSATYVYLQDYSYDDLGRVTSWAFESAQGDPGYRLDSAYDWATLESVTGTNHLGQTDSWIISREHHWDGGLSRTDRGNGVVEVFDDDGSPIDRPARVKLQGLERWDQAVGWTAFTWDSGPFQYDGRGSAVRRGTDFFVPAEWDQPPNHTYTRLHPCWKFYADPEDLRYIGWANEYCTPRGAAWFYDHKGLLAATTDRHNIRDIHGNEIWRRTPFTEKVGIHYYEGNHYVISVHGSDGRKIGEVQRKIWHNGTWGDELSYTYYHANGSVLADEAGRWLNDPAR